MPEPTATDDATTPDTHVRADERNDRELASARSAAEREHQTKSASSGTITAKIPALRRDATASTPMAPGSVVIRREMADDESEVITAEFNTDNAEVIAATHIELASAMREEIV